MQYVKGDKGATVKALQAALGIKADGDFGPKTEAAVQAYQLTHRLPITGIIDDKMAAMLLPVPTPKRLITTTILEIAEAEIGVEESPRGSNRGKRVEEYQRVTKAVGEPWCASFVVWVIKSACDKLGQPYPFSFEGTAYVPTLRAKTKAVLTPEPGDIFYQWFASKNRYAHTGIVKDIRDGKLITIEGNTNSDGSRDGYEVCSRYRSIANMAFGRV